MTGESLGRALIKRKKTLLSDFFLNRFYRSFSKRFATLTRTCVFVVLNWNTEHLPNLNSCRNEKSVVLPYRRGTSLGLAG